MLGSRTTTTMVSGIVRNTIARGAVGSSSDGLRLACVQRLPVGAMHTSTHWHNPITPPPPPPPAAAAPASTSSTTSSSTSSTAPSARSNVSSRPTSVRSKPLPTVPNTLPYLSAFVVAALASWAGFTVYATNKEKLSSSIFKSVVTQVKSSPDVLSLLSSSSSASNDGVVLKRETLLGGMPRVKGSVNMMQGRVDLSFRIHLSSREHKTATVYFTSIRAHKHAPFEILRFVVVDDASGESVSLLDSMRLCSIDVESGDIV